MLIYLYLFLQVDFTSHEHERSYITIYMSEKVDEPLLTPIRTSIPSRQTDRPRTWWKQLRECFQFTNHEPIGAPFFQMTNENMKDALKGLIATQSIHYTSDEGTPMGHAFERRFFGRLLARILGPTGCRKVSARPTEGLGRYIIPYFYKKYGISKVLYKSSPNILHYIPIGCLLRDAQSHTSPALQSYYI